MTMIRRLVRLLLLATLLAGTSSSCSLLGPIVGLPIRVAGSALQMLTANPVGTAAAAAAVF
jgi:hypothetical protein